MPITGIPAVVLLLGLLALGLLGASLAQLLRRRWATGSSLLFWSGGLGLSCLVAGGLLLNLHSWQRLTAETEVARLELRATAPQQYLAALELADGRRLQLPLTGDDWQLDARVLKLRPTANLLGLDARYQLERLGSRYRDPATARQQAPSVHDLTPAAGLSLTRLLQADPALRAWLDTWHGSATYMPMADAARYRISLTQSGLLSRPDNAAAREAVQAWR